MKALHCYKPLDRQLKVIQLLASMCTYDVLFKTTDSAAENKDEDVTETPVSFIELSLLYHRYM